MSATPAPEGGDPVDWSRLPDAVRARLADVAATAVGGMPATEVPVPLRRLARFTPAKRAKLGGPALLAELRASTVFRTAVVAWWDEHRSGELVPAADDPLTAAAAAVLAGDEAAAQAVAAAAHRGDVVELRAERDAALSRVDKLSVELERLRGELGEAREQARSAGDQRDAEYQQLRRRVSEQGAKLRTLLDGRAEADRVVEELRASSAAELAHARAEVERERGRAEQERRRADRAAAEVAAARQAAREARQADEVRLGLLVDTLAGAVTGLRRELALGGGGPRPGDLVTGAGAAAGGGAVDGLAALDALLAVPTVHLVVDGYNVSKTGYPELTLADQRTRLVGQLAALAARTGVEVTVVFDGAGVVAAPIRGSRGVRVLFSDPGVIADDVIRSLVAAEPHGRPVLVATSDAEVVRSVQRRGAYTVPSTAILTRLVRG
ncbi:NYN domain-containing protein [Pseudonocardia sp. KRD-184]|uniref:NYN domain-containing protein n=1 Tax=Pseudonocardia oceani TaxID=2792013 RepID=A0ABS6UFH3_9PSEU|nr:NYN domain-containing protein [Pseudonocardia oceani]MBW0092383.1 NYN domain-containing protein [Pseudonocardia oceani]MBW0099339.1 NYN domain-containing protein [Pseudonocardia oceani]MBW0111341.1 NYN domain-containing protein [Pseudonocardia oceani]MBW0125447.1 NYN domain-containing protein [Pseudonocardia oceani]MBW0130982.1 NYN domain-containing protein [Pseudonocardia oceani]